MRLTEKREQIRTSNFVVTAKSVNSGCIVLDCEFANYYIFDIQKDEIENERYRENVFRKIKCLNHCFNINAKEISGKDELIKILMEDVK